MAHCVPSSPPVAPSYGPASIDDLVRPNLRRAYPLPKADQEADERFAALLAAIAEQSGANWTDSR